MRKALRIKTAKILKEHRFYRRWGKTLTALSLVVALGMSYALILPAVTLEDKTYCGYEQHVEHAEECYTEDKTLTCELSEEGHKHDDNCYEEQTHLTCVLEENDGHMHSEGCLDESGEQICGLGDGEGAHHHSESCYTTESVLICGLDESEPHVHGEECYSTEKALTCILPLHEHTLQCYSNPEADVESQSTWERTISDVKLTGDWSEDVISIAKTQIGYRESENNYLVMEDGITKNGYTRYGEWYGIPYGDWCAMFCSFCLRYAEVDREAMPISAGVVRWIENLTELGLYHAAADEYEPRPGDLIFFNFDEEEDADHVGFLYEITEDAIKTIEGNSLDQVRYCSYEADDACIVGYGELQDNGITMVGVPRFRLDLSSYTFSFRDDTASNRIPYYVSRTGLDWLDTLYYGLVAADDDVPFNNAEEFKTFLESQPDETTANSVLQKYIYDLYEPHSGVSGNYGDANLGWPKDGNPPYHVQPTSQVNPMGTYTLADAGIVYGDKYFKNSNKTVTVAEAAGASDRAYQLDLTTETDPRPTNPSVYVIMVPTMWQMFDEAHATAQEGSGRTRVGSILTSVDEMAYLYDIKHALIRFAEYLKDQGSNAGVAIVNTQHGGDYSMILGNSKTKTGYFTTDMDQLIEAIEGWDAYGDCEHVHWSQDQLNNAMASIPNTFAGWTDADGNPVSIDSVVKNMVVIAGPTENSSGTNGYGSKLTPGKYDNVDYVWGIRTDTGTTQVSIGGRSIYSWLDTEANQNTIKANNPHYTELDDPNNPAYQICTSEDAVFNQLVNIFNYDKSATTTVKGTVENVTLEDIVTKEFSVESAVVTVTYLDDDGNPTGVVDTITMTDESKGRIILEENPDGTTTVKGVVNKIEGRAVVDMKINIKAKDDFVGSNNVKTNSGTPKVTYKHGDEEYSEDFDDEPKVNVWIKFEVPDGLTVTVNPGETVDVDGDLPYKAEDKSETIVQDVLDRFDKGYQVNGTLIFQWYDENGQPVSGTSSCQVNDGKLARDANGDYVITIPDFDCTTDASDIGTTKTFNLVVTFVPDPPVEGSVGTEVLTKSDHGAVWINVSTGGAPPDPFDPGEPPEAYTPQLNPDLKKQIDYLGDNPGAEGMDDLYRLYLELTGDSVAYDLVLVVDASNSMFNTGSNYTIDGRARADVLLDFLNGPDRDGTGFVRDFLAANEDNRISAVSFGNTARTILEWTEWEEGDEVPIIYLSPDGLTNYVAGLTVADELLHDSAIADSENQKLVIFLGDGVVTAAYGDGQLHNYGGTDPNDAGSLIRTENASSAADAIASLVDAMWDYYHGDSSRFNPDDPYLITYSTGGTGERTYSINYEIGSQSRAVVRYLRDLNLDFDQIPGYAQLVANPGASNHAYAQFMIDLANARQANDTEWIHSLIDPIINPADPLPEYDLFELSKRSFMEFMANNPDAVVSTIGFSSDLSGSPIDINGCARSNSEVLDFYAMYGRGEYYYAPDAQTLASAINDICFMRNVKMTDTLSEYVQVFGSDGGLTVMQTYRDENGDLVEIPLYENGAPTQDAVGILQDVRLENGILEVIFEPDYYINPKYTYTASFDVQLTAKAYTDYVERGYCDEGGNPMTGDPMTDYVGNTTSSGMPGFFSNAEANVTWTAGGNPGKQDYDKPVVQVPTLYELPHTGGAGTLLYTLSGIALMCAALMFGFSSRRRRERRIKT